MSRWSTYLCECPLRFGGKNCEHGEDLGLWWPPRHGQDAQDHFCGAPRPGLAASGSMYVPKQGPCGEQEQTQRLRCEKLRVSRGGTITGEIGA